LSVEAYRQEARFCLKPATLEAVAETASRGVAPSAKPPVSVLVLFDPKANFLEKSYAQEYYE